MKLVLGTGNADQPEPNPKLIDLMLQARRWFVELSSGARSSIADLAKNAGVDRTYISRLMVHVARWAARDLAAGPQAAVIRWQGRPIAKERRAWARAVKAAGLGSEVTPHVLRHTCATWALQGGMDPWDAAGLLGMSLAMLERVYGHHDANYQRAAANAFRRAG